MTLRQRSPRQRDPAHLAFVRAQPCCIKGCPRPAEAAHLRLACDARGKLPTGMQEKPDDKWSNPLCEYHHRTGILAQHKMGEEDFWKMRGIDPFALALRLFEESGGAARALEPKPAKRARPTKARKPVEQRAKIPGRALQSGSTWPQGRKLQSRNAFEKRT